VATTQLRPDRGNLGPLIVGQRRSVDDHRCRGQPAEVASQMGEFVDGALVAALPSARWM
jgi:hypothetical protein